MKLNIKQMSYDHAKQISKWAYKDPYSIYSMDGSEDCIKELLTGDYFSASEGNNLLGFYCFGKSAQVPIGNQFGAYDDTNFIDIGLGINPSLCGQGLGLNFLNNGLEFASKKLSANFFRLTVASFNNRAIKVYERAGFKMVSSFKRVLDDGEMEFWVMICY